MEDFTAANLAARTEAIGLVLPRAVLAQIVAALVSGQHVVLTGVPGTGKTTLAQLIGELARDAVLSTGSLTVTAASDWTPDHTVGWYEDGGDGPIFHPGVFMQAIEDGRWLIIDELNRADIDKALGPLFTVLSHQPVVLPFTRAGFTEPVSIVPLGCDAPPGTFAVHVPGPWRVIATMNVTDRDELHQLSHALLRRFAFVELPSPSVAEITELVAGPGEIVTALLPLRAAVELGPALYLAGARFAACRRDEKVSDGQLLEEILALFFLPQLDRQADELADGRLDSKLSRPARDALRVALEARVA